MGGDLQPNFFLAYYLLPYFLSCVCVFVEVCVRASAKAATFTHKEFLLVDLEAGLKPASVSIFDQERTSPTYAAMPKIQLATNGDVHVKSSLLHGCKTSDVGMVNCPMQPRPGKSPSS